MDARLVIESDEAVRLAEELAALTGESVADAVTHALAERILAEEHIAYPEAIRRVVSGEYEIRGRRFVRRKH